MHPAKLFTDKAAQSGCIIGTLTSFSSLFEWYSKGVKFSPTLENIDETQRECLLLNVPLITSSQGHAASLPTRKELLESQSPSSFFKKKIKSMIVRSIPTKII